MTEGSDDTIGDRMNTSMDESFAGKKQTMSMNTSKQLLSPSDLPTRRRRLHDSRMITESINSSIVKKPVSLINIFANNRSTKSAIKQQADC